MKNTKTLSPIEQEFLETYRAVCRNSKFGKENAIRLMRILAVIDDAGNEKAAAIWKASAAREHWTAEDAVELIDRMEEAMVTAW